MAVKSKTKLYGRTPKMLLSGVAAYNAAFTFLQSLRHRPVLSSLLRNTRDQFREEDLRVRYGHKGSQY